MERVAAPAATSQEKDRVRSRNAFLQTTLGVKDEKRFVSFNPETEQVLVAELRLLRTLKAKNLWHKASDAWVTALLPKGALIHVKGPGLYLYVLKTNACAALCWDVHSVGTRAWEKSATIKTLR